MRRRDFLVKLFGASCAVGSIFLHNPFRPRFRIARANTSGKILVVIFQRGGCDGLNTVVPYGEDEYYNLRPTIGIAPPDQGNSESAVDLDGFFGLHPGLADFAQIYQAGDLVIMPAVHYPNAIRSHFDGQTLVETASAVPRQGLDGWLTRHLLSHSNIGQLRAVAFANDEDFNTPDSLRGQAIASTFNNLANFNLGIPAEEDAALMQRLTQIYDQNPNPTKIHSQLLHDFGRILIDDIELINTIDIDSYVPANGAVYPASTFGRQLKQTAQLIKAGVGLEVAALTKHGWDTHKKQGGGNSNGRQYKSHYDFGKSINAFYQDLGGDQPQSMMEDVVILTMTEFGRKAKENASLGTDHGNASTWFVISRAAIGGIYLGSTGWPGLAPSQLHENRDLAHTIDYRDVLGEVLTRHLGNNNLATVLPGHTYTPVEFLPQYI